MTGSGEPICPRSGAAHRTNALTFDLCAVNNRCERQSGAIPIFGNRVTPARTLAALSASCSWFAIGRGLVGLPCFDSPLSNGIFLSSLLIPQPDRFCNGGMHLDEEKALTAHSYRPSVNVRTSQTEFAVTHLVNPVQLLVWRCN
jgi:hypothetical protein